ncbi:MAG: flagellar biosynthesis protein FlgA, partial [Gammaproteobacteria bacterium]|nr:flagellar biosynthesis protein FlgA [Gammaproteobacteria bacterium]
MRQFKFYLLITAFPAIFSASLQAQDAWQSHASIRERVTQFVIAELGAETDLQVEPGRLDRRLKLVKCLQPLDAFWPPGARQYGNTSVGISCEGEKPWKIYVQASVEVLEQVAVLDRL